LCFTVIISIIETNATIQQPEFAANLPGILNFRNQIGIACSPLVTHGKETTNSIWRIYISIGRVWICILTHPGPAGPNLTERTYIISLHQLSENKRTADGRIKVEVVFYRQCR